MKAGGLKFVVADQTSGLISEDGVFLYGPSLWYPTLPFAFAKYNVTANVPEKWLVISQGNLAEKKTEGGKTTMRWESNKPADSLALFAAERVMKELKSKNVRIFTFFSKDNENKADMYLKASAEYIQFFEEYLGAYPYDTFSIAENFFSSGFGMPTFTLLGSGAIARGAVNEYDLGHEICHNYWGNGCFSSPESSNWCEGMTVYSSNYLFLEKAKGCDEATNFRLKKSLTYTLNVKPGTEYPLEKFMYKKTELDNQVGYMQSAMTIHAVRKLIGDESFFNALRYMVKEKMFTYVGWKDFQSAFEKFSKKDLGWFFKQALEKPGIPQTRLANVSCKEQDNGSYVITGTVEQVGETYQFFLPVALYTEKETIVQTFEVKDKKTSFTFTVKNAPVRLELDPQYDVIRRLNPDEVPACMLATMRSHPGKMIVVLPSHGDPMALETFKSLADKLANMEKATVKTDREVTDAEIADNSLFLFGKPSENSVFEKLIPKLKDRLIYTKDGPIIGKVDDKNKALSNPMGALLISDRNPFNPEYFYTAFAPPSSPGMLMGFGKILFFYDAYGYIYFEPLEKGHGFNKKVVGQYPASRASTTHEFSVSKQ